MFLCDFPFRLRTSGGVKGSQGLKIQLRGSSVGLKSGSGVVS